MKVNQSPLDSSGLSQLGKTAGVGPGGAGKSSLSRSDRDHIQLSDLSARLLASGDAGGSDRAAHVQQLSSDVRGGRYQVDAVEVSRRMVDEAIRQ
jgi:anti-sigma28 factor (negative regulator of flagellin synthesis)